MTKAAFSLSEELEQPVMLRIVTRLAHSRAADHVEPGETVRAYAYFQPVLP